MAAQTADPAGPGAAGPASPADPARDAERSAAAAGGWTLAVRSFRYWLVNYRRTWRGSIYSSVANPVLYLGAMGLGLGALVDAHSRARLGGVSYLQFLAPGLLAAAGMQTAMGESLYPVLAMVKWIKTYQATAATPVRPADMFRGHLMFTTMRLAMNAAIFLAAMTAFGAVRSWWALAAVPVAVLTGLAFAAPAEAFAVTRRKDGSFAMLNRFGVIPLFLFSATFFPLTQLPGWLQPVAYFTPLWHGVALCRSLALGRPDLIGAAGHLAYLLALAGAGVLAGNRTYRRRLYV